MVILSGFKCICTCKAFPEQYEVFDRYGKLVGYIRLRWGELVCYYPDVNGNPIYSSRIGDDFCGQFENDIQRRCYLNNAVSAIKQTIKNENSDGSKCLEGSNFNCGFYAHVHYNTLIIGEERGRDGGILYEGEYKGTETPYLEEIKKENIPLYTSIVEYFNNSVNKNVDKKEHDKFMSAIKTLSNVFDSNKNIIRNNYPELYSAILEVLAEYYTE